MIPSALTLQCSLRGISTWFPSTQSAAAQLRCFAVVLAALGLTATVPLRAGAEDLSIDGTTVVLDGAHTYASVQIRNGGTLTHSAATAGSESSLDLTVAGTLVIDATSKIDVSGRGYLSGRTVGNTTTGAGTGRSGGSHGGLGFPWEGSPNWTYDDFRDPQSPGAGAAAEKVAGGAGGGVVRINAATLRLDGVIRADGADGPGGGGGGAGGSVSVDIGTLQGSGSISAAGGKGNMECNYGCRVGGGGGGGRVAIRYATIAGFDLARVTAFGGENGTSDAGPGAVGTVYLQPAGAAATLRVAGTVLEAGAWTPLGTAADTSLNIEQLLIAGAGVVAAPEHNLPITADSVTLAGGAMLTHRPATVSEAYALRLTINGALTVDAASKIDVSGRGYLIGRTLGNNAAGAATGLAGGSYGGLGGRSSNNTYGQAVYPNDLGSGGGAGEGGGGAGGGLLHVTARRATIDGAIRADGANGENRDGAKPAGSGGGILLSVGTLSGTGVVSAKGGDGGTYCYYGCRYGGGGGGGRVAIYTWETNLFAPEQVTALGGNKADASFPFPGRDGTVEFPTSPIFAWVEPADALMHAGAQLRWEVLGRDPDVLTAEISAVGTDGTHALWSGLPSIGGTTWNAALVDGWYELRVTFRDAAAQDVGAASRSVWTNHAVEAHSGWIGADATWRSDRVHIVDGRVTVGAGATLTIEAGAIVKFAFRTGIITETGGTLSAPATMAAPIILTSLQDDSAGGDTNLDGSQTLPLAGEWDAPAAANNNPLPLGEFVQTRYARVLHGGALTGNETWSSALVHEVVRNIIVSTGTTLTIQPGAVIKFDGLQGVTVQAGGRLIAQGSVAQPILFTSTNDGTAGSGINAGGFVTSGAPGDWHWIALDGYDSQQRVAEATFDHAELRYGAGTASGQWDSTGMVTAGNRAVVTFTNSTLRAALFDAIIPSEGGTANITSSIIVGCDRGANAWGGSMVRVVNSTIDGNRIGLWGHGGQLEVTNTIISNSFEAGIDNALNSPLTLRYSDVWSAHGANYASMADQTGSNGNISKDPHYVDREHGDYRLDYRSPAIDAADGSVAPATDIVGSPRYDDPRTPNTGIATAGGAYADMGAYEFVETADSNLDLIVSSVSGPTTAVAGDTVRVQWTVTNIGSGQVVGPWHDTVNLVLSPDANPTVIFAAEVLVGEGTRLGTGQSVSTSADIRVPGSIVAEHRWQVVTNTRGEVFEGRNRDNNATLSLSPVMVDLPELVIGGAALSRQFDAVGQAHWFKFVPSAGQDVIVRLDRAGTGGSTELYIAQGYMPSRERFDARQDELNAPDVSTLAASTAAQTYYVLAYPASLPAGGASFTISARALDFSLDAVGPQQVGNAGTVTLALHGGQLRSDMTFEIVDSHGGVHSAESVFISDSSLAYVTFDLTGLPLGTYSVRVRDGARTATLTNGVNVITGKPGSVQAHLATPKAMRPDWTETVTVDYVNVGDTDVPAPLMMLTAENGALALPSPSVVKSSRVQLLGIHTEGPAGVLPPGARGSITLEVTPTSGSGQITYDLGVLSDPNLQMSWDDVKDDMRPDFVPADAWDAIYANFLAEVGTSAGQFQRVLADNATYLSRLGVYTYDVQQLTMFEITQAGVSEITERYSLGPFGRGLTPWWAIAAVTDGQGNVSLQAGSLWRPFRKQADGSFRGVPGDFGTLTLAAGLYSLREPDGTIIAFRSGGTLDYLEDPNGNQVTAAYSGSQITGLVASNGDTVSYTYDARGRIVQAVDAVGRTTTYTYDSSSEHLVTATNPGGTMTLARVTGQGPAREHALQSLIFPDGTHRFYEYDDRGRLVRASGDGGAEATSYAYDSAAGVTITDANGSTTTLRFNQLGQPAHITDGLSNSTAFAYDEQNLLSRIAAPAGNTASLRYDDAGNLTRLVDPMGAQIRFGYEPMFNQLTALTNATGHTIEYQIDAHANPTSVAYPNGDKEASEYDSVGDLIAWTNARGHIIHNTYDTHDLLTRQDLPDGSHRQFTYDAHRNLTAASDARGTTSLVYDNADRLTKITYPSGRFLQFTYDAGGRRTRSTDQGGFAVNYAYDAVGRLSSLTDGSGAPIVSYTYNSAGQLARKALGNGTYTTYEYDLDGQVLHLINFRAAGGIISRFDYTYDALGRRTSMHTLDGQWTYTYDASGQLTHAVFSSTNPAIANQDLTYGYDAAGNRVRTVQNGDTTAYTTNSADQYMSVGTSGYAYDADGNLISRADGATQWTYTYNDQNQLISVAGPGGTWAYEYDALGSRTAATYNGQRTEYVVDPAGLGDVVGTYDGAGTLTARYVHGLGLVSRIDASGQSAYFGFDALGNASHLTDANGNVLNRYAYLPFGERLSALESVENPFQYVGEQGVLHEGNGLEFMRARHFDARAGRFTQRDPIGTVGGINLYAYVGNDPVDGIDPSGTSIGRAGEQISIEETTEYLGGEVAKLKAAQKAYAAKKAAAEAAKNPRGWRAVWQGVKEMGQGARQWFGNLLGGRTPPRGIGRRAFISTELIGSGARILGTAGVIWVGTAWTLGKLGYTDHANAMWTALTPSGWKVAWNHYFGSSSVVTSGDPNDLIGPAGTGTAHWIAPDQTLPYTIRFENESDATAPAQVVRITEQLDPDLDFTTFQLGNFSFDGVVVTVPAGRTFYSERLDLRATYGLYLDISANLDFDTGIVTWVFASVDPVTGTTPRDPLTGFLPPNVTSPIGEGYVTYTIRPRSSSGIGTPIGAQANIVFDTNDPIDTPQARNPVGPIADCAGDCNNSGQVTIDELLTMVDIALGNLQLQTCAAGDQNTDGLVTIDEILTAVNYALNGCQVVPPTVTPATPSPTRTTPPSPSVTVPPIVTATPSRTPTATATFTRSATVTATRTVPASATPTATGTPTHTVTASATPSPTQTRTIGPASVTPTPTRTTFPVSPTPTGTVGLVTPTVQPPLTATATRTVSGTPATLTPTRTPGEHVYCDTLTSPLAIPDSNENGIDNLITIPDDVTITGLRVEVQIDHTWVGDLVVTLDHADTLTLATLVFRPGEPPFGCSRDNIACTFDDTAATHADDQCADPPPAIAGTVAPTDPLSVFNGESSAGDWMLFVSDHGAGDTGSLVHWCVEVQ